MINALIDRLWESIEHRVHAIVDHRLEDRASLRIGVVSEYDPVTHSVKATVQPHGYETENAPLSSHHIGSGWGLVSGAQVGDQVILGHLDGESSRPIVMGRIFSDTQKPPVAQSGETVLRHQTGSTIMLAADGSVTHTSSQGLTLSAGAGVSVSSGSPMSFSGGGSLT